jgi:4'-phosphopantetheinyl transferase
MRGVDLHWIRLTDSNPATLSPDELERASHFRSARDRERFIGTRSALRNILAGYLRCEPSAIEFSHNEHGKPRVRALHFSFSRSHELAVCAVSLTSEVGVDLERIDPAFATFSVAETFFARGEIAALGALPQHYRLEAFFRCWTRKEAYVKASGQGLSMSLQSFEVNLVEPAAFLGGVEGWSIESLDAPPGYAGALVASNPKL